MAVVVPPAAGVPAPAPHELHRERLLEPLHKHRNRPLILLVAPAGFGKSTLAANYARDSGAAVAWLTLQSSDRDSQRFFGRLASAFEDAFEAPLPSLRSALAASAEGIGLARALLTDLNRASSGFILVLDDFHLVGGATEIVDSVDAVLQDLPDDGQVVITARESPALSMTQLVVNNAVYPLGTEDLRFTTEETASLRQAVGGDASRDAQAEGWVTGILLGGAPHQLGAAGGSLLGSYVEREVLLRLRPAEQDWLATLAVAETITPNAAERLLGTGSWSRRLQTLADHCPFLAPGTMTGSYRLHALVREALLNRLGRLDEARSTHAWTVARDLAIEAADPVAVVRACHELGQLDGAIEMVRRSTADAMQIGRWAVGLSTLELLPPDVRRAQPDMALAEARALLNLGRLKDAQVVAEASLHHGGRTGEVSVQVAALVELATISVAAGDLPGADDWLSAADHLLRRGDLPPDEQRLLAGRTESVRAISAALQGRADAARAAFESAEHLLSRLQPTRDLALLQHNFGTFCTRSGDYQTAQHVLTAAASHWRVVGDRSRLATTQATLGDLNLRLGNIEAAGQALANGRDAAIDVGARRQEGWLVYGLSRWHRACGRILDAIHVLDEALHIAPEQGDRELLVFSLVARAELAVIQHDLSTARDALSRAQALAQQIGSDHALAASDRALGRFHLADDAVDRAVSHFEAAARRGADSWSPDEQAEVLYWLGTAFLQLNRPQHARRCLEQALDLIEQHDRPAMLASAVAEDSRLLEHGREIGQRPVLLRTIERLALTRQPWTGVDSVAGPRAVPGSGNPLPRLDIQLFTSFVIERDGQRIERSRKVDRARELLALLVLNPNGVPDDASSELMWPDMTPERARHNLQQAALTLRGDLGSKAAVRFSAHTYQLNPQLELVADVREFDAALARARGSIGPPLEAALRHAVDLYRDPLLPDVGWHWVEGVREDYRARFVGAALQLADVLVPIDLAQSDALAERALAVAPETETAYERLVRNARARGDGLTARRLIGRYEQAAAHHGFHANPRLLTLANAG